MLKKCLTIVGICLFIAVCFSYGNCKAQEDATQVGGWSHYKALDDEAQKIFEEATNNLVGAKYTPFCVSGQVVAGKNYCFLCLSTTVTPDPVEKNVYVEVFVGLDGKAGKPKFTELPPQPPIGGYSVYRPLTDKDKNLFQEALKGYFGIGYTPFCVAVRGSVQGGNPKFFCEGKPVTLNSIPENDFVTVNAKDQTKPEILKEDKVSKKTFPYVLDTPKKDV
ncbi:MAG: hypothetical protein LBC02_00315, partial [Planctomycetaceae bacterium]|nr:hypothetical protein [Planctomycetaceae bacterium]